MLADWVEVVEVEAVIGGVLRGCIVDWHPAEPADCVLCFALVEECGFVFFELACGLAGSWHVVTALWCFVPESDRWYLCFPPALTIELSKLDMNNGPTIFWLNHSTNIRQYSISTVTVK